MEGVHHPHSLLGRGKTTWVCESMVNRLISSDGDAYDFPSTYLVLLR